MPTTPLILICSEIEQNRDAIKHLLANSCRLIIVEDPELCLATIKQRTSIKLALIGTSCTNNSVLSKIRQIAPEIMITVIGEDSSEESAISAVNQGANGYIMAPVNKDAIASLVTSACTITSQATNDI